MEAVVDPEAQEAFAGICAGFEKLHELGVNFASADDSRAWIRSMERVGRMADAARVAVVDEVDRGRWNRFDGHSTAAVMVAHVGHVSLVEARRRAKLARALRRLPKLGVEFAEGRVGRCQAAAAADVFSNPRVRDRFVELDGDLAVAARMLSFEKFEEELDEWERLTDEDGAGDRARRAHEQRDARITQLFDGSFQHSGGCGSVQGIEEKSIFERFVQAERDKDWAAARAEHGDGAMVEHLARSEAQRRADARHALYLAAASAHAASPGGSVIITDIVWDHNSFERLVRRRDGEPVDPIDVDLDLKPKDGGIAYRCSTLDGDPVDRSQWFEPSLLGHFRRVVVGADSVVTDLGRRRRLFSKGSAFAVRTTSTTCVWPGCHVPVTVSQIDHMTPWGDRSSGDDDSDGEGDGHGQRRAGGGETNPANGCPLCGRHNRLKERGARVERDATGAIHVYRPDGTEID